MLQFKHYNAFFMITILAIGLGACGWIGGEEGLKTEAKYPTGADRGLQEDIYAEEESIFGDGSIFSFGRENKEERSVGDPGLDINGFLWRASLDTISFMPLASADPFGGVIITDWYQPPETKAERFKLNVFILGRELRTNAIKVKAFRQIQQDGTWRDADVSAGTRQKLEDTILTRARALRVEQLGALNEIEE